MFETIKSVVATREFMIGAGVGVASGVIGGYFAGRHRAAKEVAAINEEVAGLKSKMEAELNKADAKPAATNA